jgi:alpha-beta hydrolase superfamily lysophospholipase
MRTRRWRIAALVAVLLLATATIVVITQLPAIGAGGLLYPMRRRVVAPTPPGCVDEVFQGVGVDLRGWRCGAAKTRRGTIVYLHGVADNRASGVGVIQRFTARGFDVVAYDSRAHGELEGDFCTYGFFEKQDLRRVIDTFEPGPVVLIGHSLGAAVALQHAAGDDRVRAVIAAETFSDLRTVATDRAPFFFTDSVLQNAFALAEARAGFQVDEVSPVRSARNIKAAVLLVHGDLDDATLPLHSQLVLDALTGSKRLILVPGARHAGSLRGEVWDEIDRWIDSILMPEAGGHGGLE